MLWKFFLIAIFIMLQRNAFGQKKLKFLAWVQKCNFVKNKKLPKWHFSIRARNFNFFWPKAFFQSNMKMTIRKKIP
jgi:hypothetical protein